MSLAPDLATRWPERAKTGHSEKIGQRGGPAAVAGPFIIVDYPLAGISTGFALINS